MLTWASSLDRAALAADGHRLVEFSAVRREVESRTRRAQQRRTSLASPAEEWLSGVAAAGKLAILGVRLTSLADLRVLHGYVLEPALRSATAVAVECEQRLTRLPPVQFVDPEFGYPYTLERALDAAMRLFQDGGERLSERRAVEAAAAADESALDARQRSAVAAREGVVQVIAPAGSGKTAVLIERVRELAGRGAPEERILCTTFNRDARVELRIGSRRPASARSRRARLYSGARGVRARGQDGELTLLGRMGAARNRRVDEPDRVCLGYLRQLVRPGRPYAAHLNQTVPSGQSSSGGATRSRITAAVGSMVITTPAPLTTSLGALAGSPPRPSRART
jgi:hypothetical protein